MHHRFDAADRMAQDHLLRQRAIDDLHAGPLDQSPARVAGNDECSHRATIGQQALCDAAPDSAAGAGDQNAHRCPSVHEAHPTDSSLVALSRYRGHIQREHERGTQRGHGHGLSGVKAT